MRGLCVKRRGLLHSGCGGMKWLRRQKAAAAAESGSGGMKWQPEAAAGATWGSRGSAPLMRTKVL